MPSSSPLYQFPKAALALCLAAGTALAAEPPLCASVNATKILVDSRASKAAQERLKAEFAPKFEAVDPVAWSYDPEFVRRSDAAKPVQRAYERRRNEELNALVQRVNDVYLRLGREQGFKLLLQDGEQEPAYQLDKTVNRAQCTNVVDLTSQVIDALDRTTP